MGGIGSGRYYRTNKRLLTDNYAALDIRRLHNKKLLIPGNVFECVWSRAGNKIADIRILTVENKIFIGVITKKANESCMKYKYPVQIVWTCCFYGGKRPWFLCPAAGCNLRVAILYGGSVFACRHCYGLSYKSQSFDYASESKIKGREHEKK